MHCISLIDIEELGVAVGDPIFVQPDLTDGMVKIEYYDTDIRIRRLDVKPVPHQRWQALYTEKKKMLM